MLVFTGLDIGLDSEAEESELRMNEPLCFRSALDPPSITRRRVEPKTNKHYKGYVSVSINMFVRKIYIKATNVLVETK